MAKKIQNTPVAVEQPQPKRRKRIPLRITDLTLRDGHQSLWATRMRTKDIMGIIDVIDNVGFYSLEVWGGATFDVCLRFLRENPWERLRLIKAAAPKTPLQMLLRGQNVLGYRNYPDDVLDRFVDLACENGIDIFRIFDALNDVRNLERAIKAVKRNGAHAQGTICYTTSPVHTIQKYVQIAKDQVSLGIDSLAIKDMAGILSPIQAEKLITALIKEIDVPVQVHCHSTSGMATATYVEAVRAGAGAIDCDISVMAEREAHPPVETMLAIFSETPYHASLDVEALRKVCTYFTELWPKRAPKNRPPNPIDPEILIHHIPGGMISNLRSQLEQQGALDRLGEVLKELPKTRQDLGYPPLVTPTSQILGVQAVLNVLAGERYGMVPEETKNYVRGLYGRSPAAIDPEIQRKILGDEEPIQCRPADLLPPMLPQATLNLDADLIQSEEDIISYCIFPEPALDYFKWRRLPTEERPSPPADIEERKAAEADRKAPATPTPQAAKPLLADSDYREISGLLDKVRSLNFSEVVIRRNDVTLALKAEGASTSESPGASVQPAQAPAAPVTTPSMEPAKPEKDVPPPKGPTIDAPLNGTFYLSPGPGQAQFIKEGESASEGAPVCIVEAMKLFNQIKAPFKCKVVKFLASHGQAVRKGDPLVSVEKI